MLDSQNRHIYKQAFENRIFFLLYFLQTTDVPDRPGLTWGGVVKQEHAELRAAPASLLHRSLSRVTS